MATLDQLRTDTFTDPARYQSFVLERRLWEGQKRICQAIAKPRAHVAVKACHASGKTFTASGLVPWWLNRYPAGKVITTAPTLRQVKLMWNEISLALDEARKQGFDFPQPSTTGIQISKERYGIGMSSSRGVNVQGFHGSDVLIIADEAPGIDQDIWDAIEGIRAGGDVTLLELGNPVIASGHFYENFTRGRGTVQTFTISAYDTPNLRGLTEATLLQLPDDQLDYSINRYLVSRRWVRDRLLRWGPKHPMYQARVLGQFPTQSADAVFSLEWIERAARELTTEARAALRGKTVNFGIDVAGPGEDETVLYAVVEGNIVGWKAWELADPRGAIMLELGQYMRSHEFRIGTILVDIVGIGYHVATYLAEQGLAARQMGDRISGVFGFNGGDKPRDPAQFANSKSESYWAAREWFERGAVTGLADEETMAQLTGIRWKPTPAGRILIESKEDARKRGVTSPDRAEALIMALTPVTPRRATGTWGDGDSGMISPV